MPLLLAIAVMRPKNASRDSGYAHLCIHNQIYYNVKLTQRKLMPGLVTSYDLRPENGTGLFWQE